jgi:hypothetical protein
LCRCGIHRPGRLTCLINKFAPSTLPFDAYNSFRNAAVAESKEAIKVTIVALPFSATGVPPAVGGAGFAYGFLNYYFKVCFSMFTRWTIKPADTVLIIVCVAVGTRVSPNYWIQLFASVSLAVSVRTTTWVYTKSKSR